MTKEQFLQKVDELSNTTTKIIKEKAELLIKSRIIELDSWDDNYRLPKIFMCAVCKEMSFQWRPLTESDREEVKSVERLI